MKKFIDQKNVIRKAIVELLIVVLLFFVKAKISCASDFYVTSVIRDFPLKGSEKSFADIYINAGSNNGLRKGLVIDAIRKFSVFDNINSKLIGETPVKIAKMKLIHVDKSFSIARLIKFYDPSENPLPGHPGVMIGDLVEVSDKQ